MTARCELAYVLLKPECVASASLEPVVRELTELCGGPVRRHQFRLTATTVHRIYASSRWVETSLREMMVSYLCSGDTVHLVFGGGGGLHKRLNDAKGRSGEPGTGLRGRYVGQHTSLSPGDLQLWHARRHPDQAALDLEMYAKNLIHVPDTAEDSERAIRAVFSNSIFHDLLAAND